MPGFLMIITIIGGIAFADNKGHECIEDKGFKTCAVGALEAGKPVDYSTYND